jgi:zinc/manganese transport system substrate-binding protein
MDAINELIDARTVLAEEVADTSVAVTEPLPLYLLDALALVNETPADFSEAVEAGVDAPADVMQQMLALFSDDTVSLLVVNEQTSGPQTDAVIEAAESADIPVIGMTETLPDGDDYQAWMAANLEAIGAALGQ